jgi:hypothetical protein
MAQYPPDLYHGDEAQRWRRALANRFYKLPDEHDDKHDPEHENQQTIQIQNLGIAGLVLRKGTVLACERPIDGGVARNFRSYWGESLLLGVLQQSCLEEFEQRLAMAGPPRNEKIEGLYTDWLSFGNLLWWSKLSTVANPPQDLLALLQKAHGSEPLFRELEGDMVTYNERQHRELEDRQGTALFNLQVYGSALLVLGTFVTIIGLFDSHGLVLAVLLAIAFAFSAAVLLLVRGLLND